MAGIFRRFRKEKAATPAEEEREPTESPEPEGETEPVEPPQPVPRKAASAVRSAESGGVARTPPAAVSSPTSSVSPSAGPSTQPSASAALPEARGPPPPLPSPSEEASNPRAAGGPGAFARCFLCGTRLDGPWCPTCRMVWND